MKISRLQDLKVYQAELGFQQRIFEISKTFPAEERYSLTDQIRRSSRSIGANTAEAWHKRRYEASFVHKLTDCSGENAETQHWVETARLCNYIDDDTAAALIAESEAIGRMLGSMIRDASKWCQPS